MRNRASPCGIPPRRGSRQPCSLAAPRWPPAGAVALRRERTRVALCAIALAAAALVPGPPVSGQEHNATSPTAGGGSGGDLAERVGALERAVGSQDGESALVPTVLTSLVAILAATQSAYLAVLFDRRRRRPMLAWSTHGEGRRLGRRDMPDGSSTLMVRVTNVGDAPAVDIESRTTASVRGPVTQEPVTEEPRGGAGPAGPTLDFVGSLHPEASADIPISLSSGELSRIQGGGVAVLDIVLEYRRADGRQYSSGIAVVYSGRFEVLVTRWRD